MIHLGIATWGVDLRFTGSISRQELSKLLDDLRKAIPSALPLFGGIIDLSEATPIHPEHRDLLLHLVQFLHSRGMVRLAASVPSSLVAAQMRRLCADSGTPEALRCLEAQSAEWRIAAELWAISGREPPGSPEVHETPA